MELEPSDWQRFTHPGFRVEFSFPLITPGGQSVHREEEQAEDHRGDIHRVHLTSRDRRELYVEVVRFRNLAPHDEYRSHKPHLEQRFGAGSVTDLTETRLRDRAAFEYAFSWPEGERAALLVPVASDTYRVIYDPRSELNAQVLGTITIAE